MFGAYASSFTEEAPPPSVTKYYGNPDTPYGTVGHYIDGGDRIRLGTWYYSALGHNDGWQCVGGRVYVPDGSTIGQTIRISAILRTESTRPEDVGGFNFNTTPAGSADVVVAATGWVEASWPGFDFTDGQSVFIFYEWLGVAHGWYEFMAGSFWPDGAAVGPALPAPTLTGLYISEPQFTRSYFSTDSDGVPQRSFGGAWYGADIVVGVS